MLVNEFLEHNISKNPDKTAIVSQKMRYTYKDIDDAANSLAHALIKLGFIRQDRAAIYLDNSVESVISIFSILKASGIFVVVNSQVKPRKIEFILNDCQVKVLVTDFKHYKSIMEILPNCKNLKAVILIDDHKSDKTVTNLDIPFEIISFNDIKNSYPISRPDTFNIDIDLACLIYTSGTTSNPKGVMLSHLNMVSAANSIIEYLENTNEDIIFNCLPLSFDYGLYQILMAFKFGGTVVLERSFLYPYQAIDLIVKENVTGFPIVPTIAAILLKLKNLDKYDFSKLRYISNTAQALPKKHIEQLQRLFSKTRIYSMYGLTECKRVSYLPPEDLAKKPLSVGKAMPNTEVYIVDDAGNRITNPDEVGELVVRGANVMIGYWNLPDETGKTLRQGKYPNERVLYTGDLFKTDHEDYLYFVGRKDDMIKTAGERVSPKEIENVLFDLDDILEAGVIGIPDDLLGNAIKAVVVLKTGSTLTEKEIIAHCSKYLENFMIPKIIEMVPELPKTSSGKISRKDLK